MVEQEVVATGLVGKAGQGVTGLAVAEAAVLSTSFGANNESRMIGRLSAVNFASSLTPSFTIGNL